MTNTMQFREIIFDGGMYTSGHTLLLLLIVCLGLIAAVFGIVRIRRRRRSPATVLPRKLMLVTGIVVAVAGVAEAFLAIGDSLFIASMRAVPLDAAGRAFFMIELSREMRILCLPLTVSALAFCLAVVMSERKTETESPTSKRTVS